MKHTIRFIILFFALVMAGTGNVRAISESDIIINVQPNKKAGTVAVTEISGMKVTITANPATDYSIDADHIIAEKMVDAMAPRRTSGLASKLDVTDNGSNSFSFTIPEGYTGAYVTVNFYKTTANGITSLADIPNTLEGLAGNYVLTADVNAAGFESLGNFTGTLDGGLHKIIGLSAPLFSSTSGSAIIRNIIFEDVNISSGDSDGDAGAVTCKAAGNTRIYNCGINPTSVERDNAGNITGFSGSTVSGSGNVGGLVGTLSGNARVINCYSYANITGGTSRAGIVGYNNVASTQASLTTMVMNCMFYGDISTGGTISPIYGGTEINNVADGMNNYNYYRYKSPYSEGKHITNYNRALAMEEKFITRFERYRLLLNSNKKLAAKYASTASTAVNPNDMAKWVLETADRSISGRDPYPYPILKAQGKHPSIINYDADHAPDSVSVGRLNGGKLGKTLAVTIRKKSQKTTGGQSWPTAAASDVQTTSLTLIRTDKDTTRFNFNYDKVQLPYYNDVGTGNYTENLVVTGWKITSITSGTAGTYNAADEWGGYNFADRNCTNKDKYDVSKRVFSQGAYWDVPEGVTAITIEPYWAIANYVSDATYDVVYDKDYNKKNYNLFGQPYEFGLQNNADIDIYGDGKKQKVYTNIASAIVNFNNTNKTVYDQAVVLVGNVHQEGAPTSDTKPYTLMSIDMNHDNEPDYSYIFGHSDRQPMSPIRYDFLNIMGIAEAQIPKGATLLRNVSIFNPSGWFEITNTCVVNFSQFEYDNSAKGGKSVKSPAPLILLGGTFEQFVSTQSSTLDNSNKKTLYIHVGSNAWFAKFGNGTHSDGNKFTPHIPISVTGGDYDEFYLSGTYQPSITNMQSDNAECYISGGRFGEVAGASLEAIQGDVRWDINWADITNFYGGGVNGVNPITGNIRIDMTNSYVNRYCGGPKFGDMTDGKTVTTNATDCVFGTYFGAGFGGNAYNRVKYRDESEHEPHEYQGSYTSDRGKYYNGSSTNAYDTKPAYGKKGKGVATDFDYEFFVWSSGKTGARFFVKFVSFSLATTHGVTSNLTKCKVKGNVYGGGSLGKVDGNVSTTLNSCEVSGSVFGGGYSATRPKVDVRNTPAFIAGKEPKKNMNIGMFEPGEINTTEEYEWKQVATSELTNGGTGMVTVNGSGKKYVYTDTDLSSLGSVTGNVTLIIEGSTTVAGSVYGGGEESAVEGNTEVNVTGGTIGVANAPAYGDLVGNVYGGGRGKADDKLAGLVKGNTQVTISGTAESPFIYHNVYGGGAYGSVGDFIYDNTGMPTALNTENTGECNVTITGGKIGTNGQNNGMVFGSSRGNVAAPGAGGIDPNDSLAWVYDTHVIIGESGGDTSKPLIRGSVYGSGENGHTLHNTDVKVHSGTIGIAEGEEITYNGIKYSGPRYIFRGNVYGGGCGTDTYDTKDDQNITKTYYNFNAGIVKGNTYVTIDGGHVIHDVYGGGSMGSVGTFTFNDAPTDNIKDGKPVSCTEGTGTCHVTISGGMIGTTGMQMTAGGGPDDYGHVFGAGRGETKDSIDYPNVVICAYFNKTEVTINNSAFVMGSVYGGSESGHVLNDTKVTIAGGQIGCGEGKEAAYTEEEWAAESPSTLKPTSHWDYVDDGAPYDQYADEQGNYTSSGESAEGGNKRATDGHTFYGNVFGGGSGYYPYAPKKWLFSAGRVEGKSEVVITGGHILNNVYGGCEMSDVYRNASITMSGGTVGVPRSKGDIKLKPTIGHIYGAGMGDKRIFFNTVTNVASTTVNIYGGKVYGSVHGGGEDGHVLGNTQTTISGDVEIGSVKNGETSGFDGNVFGGGQGSPTALTAGTVGGNVELNILGGTMYGSVYGGGRIASVGTYFADATHANYGKMQEGTDHGYITVNLTGGTIEQNVFGGCMGTRGHAAVDQVRFAVSKNVTVKLNENVGDATRGCAVKGSIFGCNNVNSSPQGQVEVHIYKTQNADASQIAGPVSEGVQPKVKGRYDVKAVYGGGNMAAYLPKGPTDPNDDYNGKNTTYKTKVIIEGCEQTSIQQVYGGGNAASTPATEVTVNGCYEIEELFGGGNGATKITYNEGTTWYPNPGANVGFYNYSEYYQEDGVDKIKDADNADTPENRDKNYGYGTGEAAVNVLGGHIHRVFGGSNMKGNVRKTAVTLLEELLKEDGETPCCPFNVEEAYGGGKSAPMDAEAKLLMACIPGLNAVYGGAEAADIQGDVTLNITNGTFDRVFGGNNKSGTISGSITVNIEEVGCRPIIIGELYGGGNLAGYSVYGYNTDGSLKETGSHWDHPQVNVKSFTSIGSVYGGGYGTTATMVGNPTVNINVAMGDKASVSAAVIGQDGDNWKDMAVKDAQVVDKSTVGSYPIPYHKSGQIGAISQVFGGGNAAPVKGDTEVNIGTTIGKDEYLPVVIKVGDTFPTLPEGEKYYTRSGTAPDYTYTETTDTTAQADTDYYRKYEIKGVDIRGNVYGGGNNAEVTGNTNVNIGKKKTE